MSLGFSLVATMGLHKTFMLLERCSYTKFGYKMKIYDCVHGGIAKLPKSLYNAKGSFSSDC